jgi:hypothetical protein
MEIMIGRLQTGCLAPVPTAIIEAQRVVVDLSIGVDVQVEASNFHIYRALHVPHWKKF